MEEKVVRHLLSRFAKITALAVVIGGTFCIDCAAEDLSVAARVAAIPSRSLQLILADPTHPEGLRWIVWDEGIGANQMAHIALCDRAAKCYWSHTWSDGYAPTIQYMGSWSTQKLPIFLAIYSEGAEAQTAVVIGLPYAHDPTLFDQRDGAWIAVAAGEDYLKMSTSSGSEPSLECLRWNNASMRLYEVRCH